MLRTLTIVVHSSKQNFHAHIEFISKVREKADFVINIIIYVENIKEIFIQTNQILVFVSISKILFSK